MERQNLAKEQGTKTGDLSKHRSTLLFERTNLIEHEKRKKKRKGEGKSVQEKKMKSQLAAFAANMQQMQARGIKFNVTSPTNRNIQRPHSAAAGAGNLIRSAFERNVSSPLFKMKNSKEIF